MDTCLAVCFQALQWAFESLGCSGTALGHALVIVIITAACFSHWF